MTTIIISDLHNRTRWVEHFLAKTPHDEVVFTGDYLDSFNDGPTRARETAEWLRHSLQQPKRIHCFGNHDMAYAFPANPWLECDGWSREKNDAVRSVLTSKDWRQLVLMHKTQGWYLSHAGIDTRFAHPILGWTKLDEQVAKALKIVSEGCYSLWLARSFTRGGNDALGGITWQDWQDHQPDPDLKQVMGHTQHKKPQVKGTSHCIDTHSMHYGVIENGHFYVEENLKNVEAAH